MIRTLVASAALAASMLGSVQAAEVKALGLAVANLQANFFNQIKQSAEAEAAKHGIKVITVDAKGDGPTQVNQVQDLLTQKIAALLYITAGAAAATVPTKLAQAAGIPVASENYPGVLHEFFGMGAAVDQARKAEGFAAGELKKAFANGAAASVR